MHPRTEDEFQLLMERIDGQMQAEGIAIPWRPLKAQSLIAIELGEPFIHPYPKRPAAPGVYTGHDLTIRVEAWFDERYGDRLAASFSPGSLIVLLRGDPWLLTLPRLVGSWVLIASLDETSDPGGIVPPSGAPPSRYNVLDGVVELPAGLRHQLKTGELTALAEVATMGLAAFHHLEAMRSLSLVSQALSDHAAAVRHLIQPPVDYGQAKWSALQATEKVLKAFITFRSDTYAQNHHLSGQAEHCERLGLPTVPRPLLAAIQCPAGVRYGDPPVTLVDAVASHHASLRLSLHVAKDIVHRHVIP